MHNKKLIGPFTQILAMNVLPDKGALKDEQLQIISGGGILVEGEKILKAGVFGDLRKANPEAVIEQVPGHHVALPGFIDAHTHICFGGSRARDFAARTNGKTYLEIAQAGGGIRDTVQQTRKASEDELVTLTGGRLDVLLRRGITTVEVKSGYGLSLEDELKQLRAIKQAGQHHNADVVSTCLSAHIVPEPFTGQMEFLEFILREIVPVVQAEKLTHRFDIFIESSAFGVEEARYYLQQLKARGFHLTVHGDQFTTGGSKVAVELGAVSVDHLEASGDQEIELIAKSQTIATALPGASIGLGCAFTPSRKLLDAGACLAIASDWNPGSAPQGNLLTQASILSTFEKLSAAEVFAGITYRAAKALDLYDRGKLASGYLADIIAFPTSDFREILYHQGEMQPDKVWKRGKRQK